MVKVTGGRGNMWKNDSHVNKWNHTSLPQQWSLALSCNKRHAIVSACWLIKAVLQQHLKVFSSSGDQTKVTILGNVFRRHCIIQLGAPILKTILPCTCSAVLWHLGNAQMPPAAYDALTSQDPHCLWHILTFPIGILQHKLCKVSSSWNCPVNNVPNVAHLLRGLMTCACWNDLLQVPYTEL